WIYDWVTYLDGLYSDYILATILPDDASFQSNLGWGVVHEIHATTAPEPVKQHGLQGFAHIFACGAALFSDGYVNAISGSVGTILRRFYRDTNPPAFDRFTAPWPLQSLRIASLSALRLEFGAEYLAGSVAASEKPRANGRWC
ncbi:unnamed protein product, partial [Tilletia caries]